MLTGKRIIRWLCYLFGGLVILGLVLVAIGLPQPGPARAERAGAVELGAQVGFRFSGRPSPREPHRPPGHGPARLR